MRKKPVIIIVEDDQKWLQRLINIVKDNFEAKIEEFSVFSTAEDRILKKPVDFDLLITDIFPSESPKEDHRFAQGLKFADLLYETNIQVIIVTGDKYALADLRTDHKVFDAFDKGKFDKTKFINSIVKILKKSGFKYAYKIANKGAKKINTTINEKKTIEIAKTPPTKDPPYFG